MSDHQQIEWEIFCIVVNEEVPFPVNIQPGATVGALKDAIKIQKQPEFDGFAANRLTLYLVSLPDDDNLAEIVKPPPTAKLPTGLNLSALKVTKKIGDLLPDGPAEETVYILVQTPDTSRKRRDREDTAPDDDDIEHHAKRHHADREEAVKIAQNKPVLYVEDDDDMHMRKVRPRHSSPTAPILDSTARRDLTVHALYERLECYRFLLVRGTPASGKSTLAALLAAYMRNMQPALDPIIISSWQKADDLPWDTRLSKAGNYKDPNTVIIIDDAQLTYWDVAFWNQFVKTIVGAVPPSTFRVILFAAYGSPKGRATVGPEGSPAWIPAHCRIGLRPVVLDEDPITPVGLLLTFEEFADMVKKICPEELFEQDFLDYMFCATAGQAGAVADLLRIVTAHDSYRSIKREDKKYSLERFRSNISIKRLWTGLENGSIFRRGLPHTSDLQDPCIARVFRAVLSYNFVTDQRMVSMQDKEALQRCFKNGWLHATTTMQGHTAYIFTTPLHQWFIEYYLGTNVLSPTITEQDLLVFAIHVIRRFSRGQLSSKREIGVSSKQRPPEAQFLDEFYRCCHMHSDGSLITFPEFGDAKGRIDFYIPFKKWGVELLRDGDRLANHSSRFTNPGAYSKMEFKDYVILDFRTTRPSLAHPGMPKLFHVVLENNYGSVTIVRGSSLESVEEFELLNS